MAWNNGLALREVGRFEEAIAAYRRDVDICRELEDGYGQAQTLENLGAVHAEVGQVGLARLALEGGGAVRGGHGGRGAARVRRRLATLEE